MTLTRDQILGQKKAAPVRVSVPEWGGDVYVRMMSSKERDAFEFAGIAERKKAKKNAVEFTPENVRARLVAATACNEEGNTLFTDDDVAALGEQSCAALDRIWEASSKLNRFTREDAEELVKN
jgi:hypothetical protein